MENNIDFDELTHDFLLNEGSRGGQSAREHLANANENLARLLETSINGNKRRWAETAKSELTKARNKLNSESRAQEAETAALEDKIAELESRILQYEAYKKLGE